ncbi:MAG: hypothetical protein JEY94_06455 [Melioribacteraceae bacterium]|nr:hypothetical protein [Melioribacteraceae bacterium]
MPLLHRYNHNEVLSGIRWTARLFGTLLLFFVFSLSVGSGVPKTADFSLQEVVLFASLLTMLAGLVLAYKWEFWGAVVILLSFCAFAITSTYDLGFFFILFPIVGILYLIHFELTKK